MCVLLLQRERWYTTIGGTCRNGANVGRVAQAQNAPQLRYKRTPAAGRCTHTVRCTAGPGERRLATAGSNTDVRCGTRQAVAEGSIHGGVWLFALGQLKLWTAPWVHPAQLGRGWRAGGGGVRWSEISDYLGPPSSCGTGTYLSIDTEMHATPSSCIDKVATGERAPSGKPYCTYYQIQCKSSRADLSKVPIETR